MSATVREIVDAALRIIGEVSGPGTQMFTEDRMLEDAKRAFHIMFKKRFWEQYSGWFRGQLDGTLGVVTTNLFTNVADFSDFKCVRRDGQEYDLPILGSRNPYTVTGTRSQYWTSLLYTDANYAGRKLQLWPKACTEYINVYARISPYTAWSWDSVIYLDDQLITHAVAWLALSSDNTNPGSADDQKDLMTTLYTDIVSSLSSGPQDIRGDSSVPSEWFTRP